jgi:hypothetical protein
MTRLFVTTCAALLVQAPLPSAPPQTLTGFALIDRTEAPPAVETVRLVRGDRARPAGLRPSVRIPERTDRIVPAQGSQDRTGHVDVVSVHSKALEGNLAGDSPTRSVSVYLPAGYQSSPERRYPVVYMLNGFTDSDAKWFGRDGKHWIHLPQVLDEAFAREGVTPTIVVMPNAFNAFHGSMYSSSITIGDWERFITEELVALVDGRYRTIPDARSRGLAGHSMGGYGTLAQLVLPALTLGILGAGWYSRIMRSSDSWIASAVLQGWTLISRIRLLAGSKSNTPSGVNTRRGPSDSGRKTLLRASPPSSHPAPLTKSTLSTKTRGE